MGRCVVAGCKERGSHLFPKNPELKEIWERAVKRKAKESSRLCRNHFINSDYMEKTVPKHTGYTVKSQNYTYLKKGAIPSVFPWSKKSDKISVFTHSNRAKLVCFEKVKQQHTKQNDAEFSTSHSEENETVPEFVTVEINSRNMLVPEDPTSPMQSKECNKNFATSDTNFGLCRCCLMEGQHDGNINLEVFKDYVNLFMLTDPRLSKLMCSSCDSFIKELKSFREMVLESERYLMQIINSETVPSEGSTENSSSVKAQTSVVKTEVCDDDLDTELKCFETLPAINENSDQVTVKTEIQMSLEYLPNMEDASQDHNETTVKTEIEWNLDPVKSEEDNIDVKKEDDDIINSTKCRNNILIMSETMRERLANDNKTESKRKTKNHDSESDIPISQAKDEEGTGEKKKIVLDIPEYVTIGSKREVASDNTKIRANIILLLKNSTILPFRNNVKNTFKCFYCERSYIVFKDLREHTESEHRDNVTEMTIFKSLVTRQQKIINADISSVKCKLCGKEIKTIDNLIEHLTEQHRKIYHNTVIKPSHGILSFDLSSDALRCHICKEEFTFFKNLSIHMNEHYEFFVCNSCGKKFVAEHRYRSHIFNTHGKKEVNCEHCGKTFKSKSVLLYHTNKEHVKVRINCSECSETFPMTQTVRRAHHMEEAHGIKIPLYKCEICGKDFANSGSLAGHKKNTHYQAKQYNCEICNFTTSYDKTMKSHMDIHYGIKIFECRFCQKSFTKRNTLRVHMKIHLNDKPFACPLCDVAFIQKHVLRSHMKAKHPDSGIDI